VSILEYRNQKKDQEGRSQKNKIIMLLIIDIWCRPDFHGWITTQSKRMVSWEMKNRYGSTSHIYSAKNMRSH